MLENERVTMRRFARLASRAGNKGPSMRIDGGGVLAVIGLALAATLASVGVTTSAMSGPSLSGQACSRAGKRIVPTGPRYELPLRGNRIFGT